MLTSFWAHALLWQLLLPAFLVSASGRSGYNSVGDAIETTDSGRSGYNSVGDTIETRGSGRSGYNSVGDTIETIDGGRSGYNGLNDTVEVTGSGRSGYNKIKRERTGQWTILDALAIEWSAAGSGVFVMDADSLCDNADAVVPRYLDEDTAAAMASCFNGKAYYLVQTGGDAMNLGDKFSAPRGWERVSSASARAIVLRKLVAGSLGTAELDGGQHDTLKARDAGDSDSGLTDQEVLVLGHVRLPVCGPTEALGNWKRVGQTDTRSARFPCNE